MTRRRSSGQGGGTRAGPRAIAVAAVAAAVAEMERDGTDRPQPVTTLMGIVRLMAPIILAHRDSGWSDARIAALLKEQGFEIGVGTLTVYRHRLIRERADAEANARPFDADAPPAATHPSQVSQASQADTVVPAQPARVSASAEPQAPARPGPGTSDGAPEPPRFNPHLDFDDIV